MARLTYQRERARDLWGEIRPLLEVHWKEIATYDDIPLDPDEERYNAMDDAGFLRCYTVRDAGQLIGYAIFSMATNMHYRSSRIAVQDVLFVLPDRRNARAGIGIMRYSEEALRVEGVTLIMQHSKLEHPELGIILDRMGYDRLETIHGKRLNKGE